MGAIVRSVEAVDSAIDEIHETCFAVFQNYKDYSEDAYLLSLKMLELIGPIRTRKTTDESHE